MNDNSAMYTIAKAQVIKARGFSRLSANDQALVPLHSTVLKLWRGLTWHMHSEETAEKKCLETQALSDFMNKKMMYPHSKSFKTN